MNASQETEFNVSPNEREIVMTKVVAAAPTRVWRAYTDATLIPRWWGPAKYDTVVDLLEVRHGGRWRFTHELGDDSFAFRGVYHEVIENKRLTYTFEYEGAPGHIILESVSFEAVDEGTTRIVAHSVFQSADALQGMAAEGMEGGARETMDRLAQLVTEIPD